MNAIAQFQCQFCVHEPFASMTSYLGHLSSKHPQRSKDKYPPFTVFKYKVKKD